MTDTPRLSLDPYSAISDFWGESLSLDLIQRIGAAPSEHLDAFRSHLIIYRRGMSKLPNLPRGHLRPVLTFSTADVLQGRREEDLGGLALVILLYAHEIVMQDVTGLLCSLDPVLRRRVGKWLLKIHPLYEQGVIHFRPVTSAKRHPSSGRGMPESQLPDMRQVVQDNLGFSDTIDPDLRDALAYSFFKDVTVFFRFNQSWPEKVNQLLRTEVEYAMLQILLNRTFPNIDLREVALRRLTQMAVPGFSVDIDSLIAVRRSERLFADWRDGLAESLSRIGPVEPGDDESARAASAIVYGEMEAFNDRLQVQVQKSPALRALKSGTARFGVAALAAGAGFLAGGSVPSALAAAAASHGIDSAVRYLAIRKEQVQGRAINDLVMSFSGDVVHSQRDIDIDKLTY